MPPTSVLLQGPDGHSSLLYFTESLGKVGDDFFMRALTAAVGFSDVKQLSTIRLTSKGGVLCAADIPQMLRYWLKEGKEAASLGLDVAAGTAQLHDLQGYHAHVLDHAPVIGQASCCTPGPAGSCETVQQRSSLDAALK